MNAAHLLDNLLARSTVAEGRLQGVVIGIVTNNRDPEGLHRVKVRFPWLSDDQESHWARVAAPMAGHRRGFYALPEVDDEVLVAFEHGSVENAHVLGSLWNGRDSPPEDNGSGDNDCRSFTSRSGHVMRFNDASGSETVEIVDSSGSNRIVIDTRGRTIRIEADGDIEITSATGRVRISGVGIDLKSSADVQVQAQTTVDIQATATATLKGALVKVN